MRGWRDAAFAVLSGTARALERTLAVPLLSAYGTTETTHQAASEPLPQYGPLKHGSVGHASGVDFRVVDQNGHTCPAGTVGEVLKPGRTLSITRADVFAREQGRETLIATLQQTLMVMHGMADEKS